ERFATARFTKVEVLADLTSLGLRTRRGKEVSTQTFDAMLENPLYIGIIDVPEYGVRGLRGDFDALVSEELFYRVQAVLQGRIRIIKGPRQRNRPEFPLRAFVRCGTCNRPLTASYSKGRNDLYAYYHCLPPCRHVNVGKADLEGLFVDELARLQPTPRYMHMLSEAVLNAWSERKAQVQQRAASVEQQTKSLRQKLDRLEEAFIFDRTIDRDTYERQKVRLREDVADAQIDQQASELEEIDATGILAFAQRVLPRASELWVHSTLDQLHPLEHFFFPGGFFFDEKRFARTAVSTPAFNWLEISEDQKTSLVDQAGIEPATS